MQRHTAEQRRVEGRHNGDERRHAQNEGQQGCQQTLLPHLAVKQIGRPEQECRQADCDLLLRHAHAEKLHQVIHRAAAHVGGPVLGLDAVDGILGADLAAADAAVVVGGEGVDAGVGGRAAVVGLMHGGRVAGVDRHLRVLVLRVGSGAVVLWQGTAAVAALRRARLVVGAAVRAGGLLRGFFGLGTELGLPFKPGGVLRLVHTGPDLLPAGPVVGRAAVGADDDVILVGKCLFTDRAMVSCVTCHVWYPFRNIRPLYRIKWINAKKT